MEIRVEELRVALVLTEVSPGLPGGDDGGLGGLADHARLMRIAQLKKQEPYFFRVPKKYFSTEKKGFFWKKVKNGSLKVQIYYKTP